MQGGRSASSLPRFSPVTMELSELMYLPVGVFGPRLLAPLARATAARWAFCSSVSGGFSMVCLVFCFVFLLGKREKAPFTAIAEAIAATSAFSDLKVAQGASETGRWRGGRQGECV